MNTRDKATAVCKLLGITRIILTANHPEVRGDARYAKAVNDVFADGRAFYFGPKPKSEVLGLMNDEEFLARVTRCVDYMEAGGR